MSEQEPILASWKISEVLHRHPQTLDTLIDAAPAFAKLRNPVMRRVQSKLVTVAQAARVAGIEPATLTRRLNQAASLAPAPETEADRADSASTEPPDWFDAAPVAADLDVRPIMEAGGEPFHEIMKNARGVGPGAVLRIVAGFEPVPLYDALAKQGFAHFARSMPDGGWDARFYRESPQTAAGPTALAAAVDWNAPASAEVTIDVSELVPPEPMVKILRTLESLPVNGLLRVHHVRRPIHLYDRLNQMGYPHETREPEPGRVEVLIQKPGPRPNPS